MSERFSQPLQDEIIVYFRERYALELSRAEADDYLDSLTDLLLWYGGERS